MISIFYDHGRFTLTLAKGEQLDAERLLVATGRRANLAGLGLDTVGLSRGDAGVDRRQLGVGDAVVVGVGGLGVVEPAVGAVTGP